MLSTARKKALQTATLKTVRAMRPGYSEILYVGYEASQVVWDNADIVVSSDGRRLLRGGDGSRALDMRGPRADMAKGH
jgi:hypothetical protein